MLFGICPPQIHPHLQQKLKTANKLDLHLKKTKTDTLKALLESNTAIE